MPDVIWSKDQLLAASPDELARSVAPLVKGIAPLLAGHHPAVQSSVLAELMAMHLAGITDPFFRDNMKARIRDLVDDLLPAKCREIGTEP